MTHSSRLSALCDKIIEAGWLAAVVLTPLFFNVYSSRVFEPDKLTLLRSIALLMIGAWIVKWIEERGQSRDPARADRITLRTPLVIPTLVLVAVYLVSSILSVVPRVSFMGSYQRLQGTYTTLSYIVVFWMLIQNMRKREQLDRLITTIVITSLPIAFYGLLQRGDGTTSLDPLPWGGDVTSRVASNMGNAIFVAAYLIMAFFLTLGRVVESFRTILAEEESRLSDILRASSYVFVAAVQLIAFWFANSRGPILGMGAGAFLFVLVSLLMLRATTKAEGSLNVTRMVAAVAAAVMASLIGGALGYFVVGRLVSSTDPLAPLEWAVLGAIGGGAILTLLLAASKRTWHWLWLSWVTFTVIAVAILSWLNLSKSPMVEDLRQTKVIGPLARLLDEGGTGKVRTLIWQGAVKLITPHDPLTFPDGTTDGLNFVRPLIGYGPESMYVVYNPFYPPDLAHIEARNASPDRSHNETFDAFVITGGIGFLAEQFLFVSVFYFGLKWLGLMSHRWGKRLFVLCWIVGSLLGALGMTLLKGVNFIGVGLPGGAVAGMIGYLIFYSLFLYRPEDIGAAHGHQILIVALLAGVLAHFIEIHFGIAIAATRTYFWTFAALLVVLGLRYVPTDDEPAAESVPALNAAPARSNQPIAAQPIVSNLPRHKKKARRVMNETGRASATARRSAGGLPRWFWPVLTAALIGALILITLGYEFINNPPRDPSVTPITTSTQLIVNSLTRLPYQQNRASSGALLMFFVTWLFGGLLSLTEMRRRGTLAARDMPLAVGAYYLISFVVALIFWLILAGQILSLGGLVQTTQPKTLEELTTYFGSFLTLADSIANILVLFYLFVFLIIVGMALSMLGEARTWFGKLAGDWGLVASVPIALALIIAVSATNLNAIRADTIYKQADPLRNAGQWDMSIAHYKRVIELTPDEDFYYLWLGAAYLEKAANAPATPDVLTSSSTLEGILGMNVVQTYQLNRKDSLQAAEVILKHARDLNPLNTDHSANLARLYRRWADLSTDDPARKANLDKANEQYREATTLSPNNAVLWNEWATVSIAYADMDQKANDQASANTHLQEAQARLDHSLEIDNEYDQTYLYRAQLAGFMGKNDEAIQAYQSALKISPNSTDAFGRLIDVLSSTGNYTDVESNTLSFLKVNPDSLIALRTLARNVYFPHNRIQEALTTQQRVIQLSTKDSNAWDDHRVMAIMLFQVGQLPEALQEAQTALSLAPKDQQPNVQSLVTEIQKQMNGGVVPTNTLPVTVPVPAP